MPKNKLLISLPILEPAHPVVFHISVNGSDAIPPVAQDKILE